MHLDILTPERSVYSGEAASVLAPGADGPLLILKGHAPILTSLLPGTLRIKSGQGEQYFFVSGGFLEFSEEKATLLVDALETPKELDMERVQRAKQRARDRLSLRTSETDVSRANRALGRALAREKFKAQHPV